MQPLHPDLMAATAAAQREAAHRRGAPLRRSREPSAVRRAVGWALVRVGLRLAVGRSVCPARA